MNIQDKYFTSEEVELIINCIKTKRSLCCNFTAGADYEREFLNNRIERLNLLIEALEDKE